MNSWEQFIPAGRSGAAVWQGSLAKKPWDYAVTAVIPHLNTPELLAVNIDLLRSQTMRPYILIVDTGSCASLFNSAGMLEPFRAPDVEIHYLAHHGVRHSSEPVTMAMDAAFAVCRTKYLYCTHADALLMRRDYLSDLAALLHDDVAAAGYEMSERSHLTQDWRGMVSHTATMLFMPLIRSRGVSWSMRRAVDEFGCDDSCVAGWPDTETAFNLSLRRAGLRAVLIGTEANGVRQTDSNIDHIRSYPSLKRDDPNMLTIRRGDYEDALRQAQARLLAWGLP